eukprot:3055218-Rhodomonas_salina.1
MTTGQGGSLADRLLNGYYHLLCYSPTYLLASSWHNVGKVLDDGVLRVHNAQGFWRPGQCASP